MARKPDTTTRTVTMRITVTHMYGPKLDSAELTEAIESDLGVHLESTALEFSSGQEELSVYEMSDISEVTVSD